MPAERLALPLTEQPHLLEQLPGLWNSGRFRALNSSREPCHPSTFCAVAEKFRA
jgi:hypothetical protein